MKTEITKDELRTAKQALPKLKTLVDALAGVNGSVPLGKEAQKAITVFEAEILPVFVRYKEIVTEGDAMYKNRDKELISNASTRMFRIPSDINLLESKFKHMVRASEHKTKVLREQGLSQSEIDLVNKPVTEADHQELAEKIDTLRDEEASLKAFLGDAPIFDTELLKNTSVYPESTGVS